MSQKKLLEARGLYTDPNLLSKVPEGALVEADNVIIDRDAVIESRRGNAAYGNTFGINTDRAKQLLVYKDRILIHYGSTLLFNNNPHNLNVDGDFQAFDGSYQEIEDGFRIKGVESNRNFYFTTNDGVKKISAKTAADFTTNPDFIIDAGGAKALDALAELNNESTGFLPPNSKVAYRVVWGYNDNNNNLILGSPSSRVVVSNFNNVSANVDLQFVIPQVVNDLYFYQIYRTAIFTAPAGIDLDDIDPGDEMNLVIEDFPTSAELTASFVELTDITSDDFRAGGTLLYTNPNSGEGINQANEPPPKAKDVTLYQNTLFYANTEVRARNTLSLLGVANLVSNTSTLTIDDGTNPAQTYTFVGEKEETTIDFTSYTGTIPADLDGKYWLLNSASNRRKYYVWYDNTKTTQTLDFSGYVGTIGADLDGDYIVIYTPGERSYYIWFDDTGSTIDPGTIPGNTDLTGRLGIKVDVSSLTTKAQVAAAVDTALTTNNVFNDYDVNYVAASEVVTIETESFDDTTVNIIETVRQGFSYLINTPISSDPANTPLVNTDVVGRIGFRINVSRNVTTLAGLADITAATILVEDAANDFDVTYNATDTFFTIANTNNGNTDDAVDSAIDGLANGFSITVTQQGDGEDAALNHVLLSDAATPSLQIDETARSLVNIINRNSNESVYAFYLSGPNDLPGQILLETRDIGTNQFSVEADSATTGEQFNPALPPSVGADPFQGEIESRPNRIFFSKLQQPEAVPLVNFIDVGPQDQAVSRILALRESLFLLKEDGVYRLTGINGAFTVDLFDESTKIIAPDTAVVLNNQIFCLTNQGVAAISDTGVSIISKQLDNIIQFLTSSNFNFRLPSFGVSYETDRAYWLWLPENRNDTVATQAYRYNTFTQSWTRHPIAKTCGVVNRGDDKLYLGASDENFIERERKEFNRQDYADRQFDIAIPSNSVNGNNITLAQSNLAVVGDAIVQTQNLTINQFNQFLRKLDLDPLVGESEITTFDFSGYTGAVPNDLHSKYFTLSSAFNETKYGIVLDAVGDLEPLDTIVFSDLRNTTQIIVDISGATTLAEVTNLIQNRIKSTTFDFNVSYTVGQEEFTTTTIKNGVVDDASDGLIGGIGNGFSINISQQGFKNYLENNILSPGDNILNAISNLAIELDNDPGIIANDFASAVAQYLGSGDTIVAGNPTVINSTNHGLQNGRLVDISNSTSTPNVDGTYIVTKIDNDNFSINVTTSVGGTCNWAANINSFAENQARFNTIIKKINLDNGALYSNYSESTGTSELEVLILNAEFNNPVVGVEFGLNFLEGPAVLYKGIQTNVVYAPETFGDPSVTKQVREGTFMFENNNFTRALVGYKTDLSPGFDQINFNKSGKGDWGFFGWSQQNWGGGFAGIPLRTYIPRSKQRCRFIQAQFRHDSAREAWALFGISYTLRGISERGYRD